MRGDSAGWEAERFWVEGDIGLWDENQRGSAELPQEKGHSDTEKPCNAMLSVSKAMRDEKQARV